VGIGLVPPLTPDVVEFIYKSISAKNGDFFKRYVRQAAGFRL